MKTTLGYLLTLVSAGSVLECSGLFVAAVPQPAEPSSVPRPSQIGRSNVTPKGFLPNVGQIRNQAVKFALRDRGVCAYFTDRGFVLWNGQTTTVIQDGSAVQVPVAPRWELVNARPVEPVGGETFPHTVSFFRGNDPAKWRSNVAAYRDLRYPEMLEGVDMRVESRETGFEYSFHVQPRVKPNLRFRYEGITTLEKSPNGDLIVRTTHGHFTESRPVSYQWIEGTKHEVISSFELVSANEYRIAVGPYDERHELVVDPVLDWSTFLGASYADVIRDLKVDPVGSICVAGQTSSADLPDAAGFSTGPGVQYDFDLNQWFPDVFVAKLNSSGTELLWLGYLGGAGTTDELPGVNGLAIDMTGNLYLGGYTRSPDFPVTPGAHQANLAGDYDPFLIKIRSDGSAILWSTYLGGANLDWGWGVALDLQENVYLTGFTQSGNFPLLNPFDNTLNGAQDVFVSKFDDAGALMWSSYLGGSGHADRGAAVAADAAGNLFVFGDTDSLDLATPGTWDVTLGGNNDAFVARIQADGSALSWATYLGGSGLEDDEVNPFSPTGLSRGDMGLDSMGNIVVAGETTSIDFPVTVGAFDTALAGDADAYVAKIAPDGASLVWASFLGGSGTGEFQDRAWGLVVNPWDEVFVIGRTDSADFPVTPGALLGTFQGGLQDGFVTKFSANGNVLYSTYLGGAQRDTIFGIAYDSGSFFVAGWALSPNFPSTAGAYQTGCISCNLTGWEDGYVMKLLDAFIAQDGFESGNFSGGSGDWAGDWSASGDTTILSSAGPHSGSRHLRLRSSTGYLTRTATVPAGSTTLRLGFWGKLNSLEGSDQAVVLARSIGPNFAVVRTFTSAQSDDRYRYHEFDLTSFLPASQIQIAFDAAMSNTGDYWYLDDIRLTGTSEPLPPPVQVFYDSFELGEWNGLWTEDTQNDWFPSTARKTEGNRSAEVDGVANDASLTSLDVNLQGRTTVTVTFDWRIESTLDAGEYLKFQVSTDGGVTWAQKAILKGDVDPENDWKSKAETLTEISQLRLKFVGKMNKTDERANLDNVRVVAQ